jgi:hypothetical protein
MKTHVRAHSRGHKENAITRAFLKREEVRGAKIEHKEHPEFSKKVALRLTKDHLKHDKFYYLKESGKNTAKKEWTTFKDFLKRKKEERKAQKALKEEIGTKLETY